MLRSFTYGMYKPACHWCDAWFSGLNCVHGPSVCGRYVFVSIGAKLFVSIGIGAFSQSNAGNQLIVLFVFQVQAGGSEL